MDPERRRMERLRVPTLEAERKAFSEAIIGQEDAVASFANLLVNLRSGFRQTKNSPLDVLFLAGPSGVGKTEITLTLARVLEQGKPGSEEKVMTINGGEYQKDHYIARLFGSPPGYIGSKGTENEIPPVLSQENLNNHRIRFRDQNGKTSTVTIILVDEAEKAHDAVHMAFLSILDKGNLSLADNSVTDFTNSVIIFTSNIGNQEIEKSLRGVNPANLDDESKKNLVTRAIADKYPPELRGRIRKFIIFNQLSEEAVLRIATKQVAGVEKTFQENRVDLSLKISPEALKYLSQEGYSSSEGARAMEKTVNEKVYEPLVLIHNKNGLGGRKVFVDLEDKELVFYHDARLEKAPRPKAEVKIVSGKSKTLVKSAEKKLEPVDESIIRKITDSIKSDEYYSRCSHWDFKDVSDQMEECIKAGIANRDQIISHPLFKTRIFSAMARILIDDYECENGGYGSIVGGYHFGTKDFQESLAAVVKAKISSREEVGSSVEVLEAARKILESQLKRSGVSDFNWVKEKLIRFGIGNETYWNNEFRGKATKAYLVKGR